MLCYNATMHLHAMRVLKLHASPTLHRNVGVSQASRNRSWTQSWRCSRNIARSQQSSLDSCRQTSSLNLGPNTSKNIRSPSKHKAKTLAAAAKITPREQKHCPLSQKHAAPSCAIDVRTLRGARVGQPRRMCRMVAHVAACWSTPLTPCMHACAAPPHTCTPAALPHVHCSHMHGKS